MFKIIEAFDLSKNISIESACVYSSSYLENEYKNHGISFVENLKGSFAFIICDNNTRKIYLVRDRLGTIPLYYVFLNNKLIVTSSFFKAQEFVPQKTLDISYVLQVYSGFFGNTESTYFTEIKRVSPCYYLETNLNSKKQVRYFNIFSYLGNKERCKSSSMDVKSYVVKSVQNCLQIAPKPSLFLSGGLDSSLIAAISTGNKSDLLCLSAKFGSLFQDENKTIVALVDKFKIKHQFLECSADSEELLVGYSDFKFIFYTPSFAFYIPLFKKAQENGSKVVMTGLGGDDVFTLNETHLSYLLKNGDYKLFRKNVIGYFNDSISGLGLAHAMLSAFVPNFLFIPLRFTSYVFKILRLGVSVKNAFTIAKDYLKADLLRRTIGSPVEQSLAYRFFISGAYTFGMENEQELAGQFGLTMSYPLLDDELILKAMDLPVGEFRELGRDKVILREMATQYLPIESINNRSQQEYGSLNDAVVARQRQKLEQEMNSGKRKIPIRLASKFKNMRQFLNTYNILRLGNFNEEKHNVE